METSTINVGGWIAKWAALRPDKVAVYADGRPFTYKVLNDRSVRADLDLLH